MQPIPIHDEEPELDDQPGPPGRARRRIAYVLLGVLVVLLLLFIPPLINVSRFQHGVDRDISAALGRPIHFDRLSLTLLPMPGFTLDNFVVEEDPAFGYEPTLRADEVHINLRLSSLWRRRVEFSSISFTDPSVNLVHTADGRWNIQGLLLQASHIPAAPTVQRHPGPAPRFPYIEATGARVNLKLDQEKTPVSFTDADFALWQPDEHQWRLRIEATPVRTDIAPGETGTVQLEGSLGAAESHNTLAEIPIDVAGTWSDAQLGGLTSMLLGRDAGLRGDFGAVFALKGTIGQNTITTTMNVENARRADFVPLQPLSVSVGCRTTASDSFHTFAPIECRLPPSASGTPASIALAAAVPDVRHPEQSTVRVDILGLSAGRFFDWLSVATPHPPTAFAGQGSLTGSLNWGASATEKPGWTGELRLANERIRLPSSTLDGTPLGVVVLRSSTETASPQTGHASKKALTGTSTLDGFNLLPVSLPLGGKLPAVLTGYVDDAGYSLHLTGPVVPQQLLDLGDAIPQFGDGLKKILLPETASAEHPGQPSQTSGSSRGSVRGRSVAKVAEPPPVPMDLTVNRAWGAPQIWTQAAAPAPAVRKSRHRSR